MGKRSQDVGKAFEDDVQGSFDNLIKSGGLLRYLRLYDTKSAGAGRFLPKQPADFVVASPIGGTLLECKASETYTSLAQCLSSMVKGHQAAASRLWVRTGNKSMYLFYSTLHDHVEAWDGEMVGVAKAEGNRLLRGAQIRVFPRTTLAEELEDLMMCGWVA